jgi:DNA-binding XRE family transcriptional regulator
VPTRRVTQQKSRLDSREKAICLRVKEARQNLRLDQAEVARRLGLKEHAISTIEKCRAPLRFDIALRFCREMLVNEQWLATGGFATLESEAKRQGIEGRGNVSELHPLFFRLTTDLWSEDVTRTIPSRTLFSGAFDRTLAPYYESLAKANFYFPRLRPNEHDGVDIVRTLLQATMDTQLLLLTNEARRLGKGELPVQKTFAGRMFELSQLLFKRSMGFTTPEIAEPRFMFLHLLADFTNIPVGPLHSETFKGPAIPVLKTSLRSNKTRAHSAQAN